MSTILIIYGSSTGNTESIAEKLGRIFTDAGHNVTVMNAANASANGMANGYDAVLMGCSAWGVDEVELQDDFAPLIDKFDIMGLQGVKVAAFASGDTSYEHFCAGVDIIEATAKAVGANIVAEGLKVEGDASNGIREIETFAEEVMKNL